MAALRKHSIRPYRFGGLITILGVLGALAGVVLFSGSPSGDRQDLLRGSAGPARLLSITPMPMPIADTDGEMCQWMPASASTSLVAALQAGPSQRGDFPQRKPVRMIRDPYSAYSAVAVDPIRNEVVLTDENLFNILVYDRLDNTPPTATMTEPKRMIGGLNTKIEFQCGLYIDPASGDIYGVNNDTVDTLVIFDRNAKGNVPPTRELYTPHGTFGIAVDEEAQELFLTEQHDNAVVVFRKSAVNDESPIRLLQGDRTKLEDPHGIAIYTKNQLMFVSNYGNSHQKRPGGTFYRPDRTAGKQNWPVREQVPGSGKFSPPSITVYALDATGDTPPLRVIQGPKTHLKNPTGVYLDLENDELWAANFGNHAATVYPREASGDVEPLRIIRSGPLDEPALGIGNPHPVAYDSKREEILVPN